MTTLTEKPGAGNFIVSLANFNISLDNIVVASGAVLAAGTVLGKITASGKYAAYANGASDGTQVAAGVLRADCDASAADTPAVLIARTAELNIYGLVWKSGEDQTSKDAGVADMKLLGISVRPGVTRLTP